MNIEKLLLLVKAICNRVRDEEGSLNKTKLLKLIYLIDIANYRRHRKTLSGFSWIFYEYGPWAPEYNMVFDLLQSSPDFEVGKRGFFQDSISIACADSSVEFSDIGITPSESIEFRSIVDTWAREDLNKLLDYVYFNTDPMEGAEKNTTLNFEKIHSLGEIPNYALEKGTASRKEIEEARKTLLNKMRIGDDAGKSISSLGIFDALYWMEMEKLDHDDTY